MLGGDAGRHGVSAFRSTSAQGGDLASLLTLLLCSIQLTDGRCETGPMHCTKRNRLTTLVRLKVIATVRIVEAWVVRATFTSA